MFNVGVANDLAARLAARQKELNQIETELNQILSSIRSSLAAAAAGGASWGGGGFGGGGGGGRIAGNLPLPNWSILMVTPSEINKLASRLGRVSKFTYESVQAYVSCEKRVNDRLTELNKSPELREVGDAMIKVLDAYGKPGYLVISSLYAAVRNRDPNQTLQRQIAGAYVDVNFEVAYGKVRNKALGNAALGGAKVGAKIGAVAGPKGALVGAVVGIGVGVVAVLGVDYLARHKFFDDGTKSAVGIVKEKLGDGLDTGLSVAKEANNWMRNQAKSVGRDITRGLSRAKFW